MDFESRLSMVLQFRLVVLGEIDALKQELERVMAYGLDDSDDEVEE